MSPFFWGGDPRSCVPPGFKLQKSIPLMDAKFPGKCILSANNPIGGVGGRPPPCKEPSILNALVTYCALMNLFLLVWHHGKVVVPGNERGILVGIMAWLGKTIVRGWLMIATLSAGFAVGGWVGPGYGEWWYSYTADHSMLLWVLTTPPITLVLWFLWHSSFTCAKSPGSMGWWSPGKAPDLHRVSMALPAVWGAVFYAWLLLTPTLLPDDN